MAGPLEKYSKRRILRQDDLPGCTNIIHQFVLTLNLQDLVESSDSSQIPESMRSVPGGIAT